MNKPCGWLIMIAAVLVNAVAAASDLGSAGPFRSLGGQSCLRDEHPCPLPAIDSTQPAAEQSRAYVDRALRLIDALRLTEAREALGEAVSRDRTNSEAYTLRGRLALTNADLGSADHDIEQALLLKPNDPDLLATRAYLRQDLNDLAQSLDDANTSLKLRPDSPDALFIRASIHKALKHYGLAFADLSYALTLAPADRRIRLMRAEVQMLLQQYEFAAIDAAEVLKSWPTHPQALMIRAAALERSGDEDGAIRELTKLLDACGREAALSVPSFKDAALQRIRLLAKTGRFGDAEEGMNQILKQGGQQAVLRLQLYLRSNGFPNVEITGTRSAALDTALTACFTDKQCGPRLPQQ